MILTGLGKTSLARLATCDQRLRDLVAAVAVWYPLTVICGHRNEADQAKAVADGRSQLRWPHSAHNKLPSRAVDLAPIFYEHGKGVFIDWDDWAAFGTLAGAMMATARIKGIKLQWGADWSGDWHTRDERFRDGPHFELVDW